MTTTSSSTETASGPTSPSGTANGGSPAITPERERAVLGAVRTDLFIGGRWRPGTGGGTVKVDDPSTGEVLAEVADATVDDGRAALDAAVAAQASWAATPPRDRGEILRRAFELITARADDLALLMTLEMGKPVKESKAEIAYAAEFFRWFSEEAVRISGRWSVAPNGASRLLTMKQAVGPCLFITPWNFPLAMGTRKIGPAIAAGCTMVVKPADADPALDVRARADPDRGRAARRRAQRDHELDHRQGHGAADPRPSAAQALVHRVDRGGKRLVEQSAEQLLRVSMELGGNAPFVVFGDADLDAAIEGAMLAKMRNMGEACTAANRFIVHESVADEFARRLAERMGALRVGRGTEDGVDVGPLVDLPSQRKVGELVQDAVDTGAEVLTGGSTVGDRGYFYAPTVLNGVRPGARLLSEEVFGPVAPIVTFADDAEGLRLANDTEYGLVAYAYTNDLKRALRVAEGLETGMVGLNAGHRLEPGGPVRRRQAVGVRPRGRLRRDRRVPRDEVRRHPALTRPLS